MKSICPICQKRWKVLKKCYYCQKWHCIECNIQGICVDCHSVLNARMEVSKYFEEKYAITI